MIRSGFISGTVDLDFGVGTVVGLKVNPMGNARPLLTWLIEFPKVARVRNNLSASWRWALSLGMMSVTVLATACGPVGIDLRDLGQNGSEAGTTLYVVQNGDTLSGIAAAHGTTVEALIRMNAAAYPKMAESQGRIIVAGWKLTVPVAVAQVNPDKPLAAAPVAVGTDPVASPGGFFDEAAAAEITRLTNEERARNGLTALIVDAGLTDIARKRAVEIVTDFSHAKILDYCACGENIHAHRLDYSALSFVSDWLASPGHRGTMMSDYVKIGVGVYRLNSLAAAYAVQDFSR